MAEKKSRKMSTSHTNHGFTVPIDFCRKSSIRKGDRWEWIPCLKSGILLLFPVDSLEGPQNEENVVCVQQMTYKRNGKPDRVQTKLNIPIDVIRRYRLNKKTSRITWRLIGDYLQGEIDLNVNGNRQPSGE